MPVSAMSRARARSSSAGLAPLVLQILDGKRVAAFKHVDARAALLRDGLPVLAGADPQRDHPPSQRVRGGADDVAVRLGPSLRHLSHCGSKVLAEPGVGLASGHVAVGRPVTSQIATQEEVFGRAGVTVRGQRRSPRCHVVGEHCIERRTSRRSERPRPVPPFGDQEVRPHEPVVANSIVPIWRPGRRMGSSGGRRE